MGIINPRSTPKIEPVEVNSNCFFNFKNKLTIVFDRLRTFLPKFKAANSLLEKETFDIEDVEDDEEYVEMVLTQTTTLT